MSVTSCPRAINSAASPLSRKQLPQYIPAAPAVIDRIFMTLPFQVPGSGFRVRVHVPVQGSTCNVQSSGWRFSNLEPGTMNPELEPRTRTRNLEPGTRNYRVTDWNALARNRNSTMLPSCG